MSGIILAKNAGQAYADDNGICAGQSVTAGNLTLTINGSLAVGGVWENPGWGFKIKATSSGNDSANNLTITGLFYASDSVGDVTNTVVLGLGNATSVATTLFATYISKIVAATITAGSITVGPTGEGSGVPVGMKYGSLYSVNYGGTFGGATVQVKKYHPLTNQWIAFDGETGETAATVLNYQVNGGATLKTFITSGSTTTAIGVSADIINPTR